MAARSAAPILFGAALLGPSLMLLGCWNKSSGEHELTKETWDDAVEGKVVFIKFLAPW